MQLTESERRVLERARKIDGRWPKTKWIALAIGVGMTSLGIWHIERFPESSILLGLSIAQFYYLAKSWRSHATIRLLLKLAEANQQRGS